MFLGNWPGLTRSLVSTGACRSSMDEMSTRRSRARARPAARGPTGLTRILVYRRFLKARLKPRACLRKIAMQSKAFARCDAANGLRIRRRFLPLSSWRDRRRVPGPGPRVECQNSFGHLAYWVQPNGGETANDKSGPPRDRIAERFVHAQHPAS